MQITEHIHAIKIPFQLPISPEIKIDRAVYSYIIYSEEIYLIDSGVSTSEAKIFDYIIETGREPDEVCMIIQTHSHPDHIGATQAIKNATNCAVAAHSSAVEWIEDIEQQYKERPVPGFHNLVGGSVDVDQILKDGDVLSLGNNLELSVYHTPGHSRDSLSFLLSEDLALFTGDAIPLAGGVPVYEDALASIKSIHKLRNIENIDTLLSSWDIPRKGEEVYQLMGAGINYLQHIHEVVAKVADKEAVEPMELCRRVVRDLGLPDAIINPLVAKTFMANIGIDREDMKSNI